MSLRRNTFLPASTAVVALAVAAAGLVAPAVAHADTPSSLAAGGRLTSGASLVSAGNRYSLTMQTDGNLVERRVGLGAVWASGTPGRPGATMTVQTDGNVVVRATSGLAIWTTNTRGTGVTLSVQDDGNIVLRSSTGVALWASGTVAIPPPTTGDVLRVGQTWTNAHGSYFSGSKEFRLDVAGGMLTLQQEVPGTGTGTWSVGTVMSLSTPTALTLQTNHQLVLTAAGHVVWSIDGGSASYLTIQDDGNLVLRLSTGRAVWSSGSGRAILASRKALAPGGLLVNIANAGAPTAVLAMQTDGNLVLRYGSQLVWSSGTRVAGSQLTMQTDGNAVVRAPSGAAVWATGTAGHAGANMLIGPVRDVQVYGAGGTFWERP